MPLFIDLTFSRYSIVVISMAPKVRGKYVDELLEDLGSLASNKDAASKLRNTIDKIGNLVDKKAIPSLLPFLDHDTDYVRAATIYALEKIRNNKDLPKLFVRRLKNETSQIVRIAIIESLGELEDITMIPILESIKNVPNEDDRMKITTIFAIDRLTKGQKSALEQLVDYLIDARNPNTRVEAAKALGKLGDKQVVDPIIKVFTDEKDFIERDFIKVLWAFPEYQGKELWEIIEARNMERLTIAPRENESILPKQEKAGENQSKIKQDYAYETRIGQEQNLIAKEGNIEASIPFKKFDSEKDLPGDLSIQKSIENAKKEVLPKLDSPPVIPSSNLNPRRVGGNSAQKETEKEVDHEMPEFSNHFNKGEKYYRKKQYYEAIISFKNAIEVKNDAWQAWFNIALVFYDVDEKEKSIECFKNALQFKPNEVDTFLNLSSLHDEIGDYSSAIRYLVSALELSRYLPDAWLLLGKLLYKTQKLEFALYSFNQVLQVSHDKRERNEARNQSEGIMRKHPALEPKDPRKEKFQDSPDDRFKLDL
jgi:tetratricopeptide (TPR) repeat protein